MLAGRTTKEIAARMRVSAKTVETHRRHLMETLNVDGAAELTRYAVREGLTGARSAREDDARETLGREGRA